MLDILCTFMKEELKSSFWHIFIHFRLTIVVTVYSQFTHKHLHSYLKSESDAEKTRVISQQCTAHWVKRENWAIINNC